MRFIHDSNLGFPSEQKQWRDFFTLGQCDVFGTIDLELLSNRFENSTDSFAYIPVACLYQERKIQDIQGLVSATTGKDGASTTSSVLIVKKGAQLKELADLRGKTYGRINQYCTSSYFAPAIHLSNYGFIFQDFFREIIDVPVSPGNWQNQIDQVIGGVVDATMVDENTWLASPKNAEQTEIIGRIDGLPCPIIVSKSIADDHFLELFKSALLSSPRDTAAMFSGFTPYPNEGIQAFFEKISHAFNKP